MRGTLPCCRAAAAAAVSSRAAAAAEDAALRLAGLAHLREPHEWFPAARRLRRHVVFHAGPTNSGKTHAALQALRAARTGAYLGPLRLLAWEVHARLNADGCPCDLVTGQERETAVGSLHTSATVEMADLEAGEVLDVGVLDEIQMLGDSSRGWAWTRALLGLPSKELHLCGDESALPLVRELLGAGGEVVEVRRYSRLAPLTVATSPLHSLGEIRKGDCVVCFSRSSLFDLKRRIELETGLRVGLLYGALPPAVRKEQARRFNGGGTPGTDAGATDVLVATDCIGMGLNLAISRIIFSSTAKFDGVSRRPLTVSEIKQIGGRAGRGADSAGGEVTSLDVRDLHLLKSALARASPLQRRAGLMPTGEQLEEFASALAPEWLRQDRALESDSECEEDESVASNDLFEDADADADPNVCVEGPASDADVDLEAHQTVAPALHQLHPAELADRVVASHLSLARILMLYARHATVGASNLFVASSADTMKLARLLDGVRPPLPFRVQLAFAFAPADADDALVAAAIRRWASHLAERGRVRVALRLPTSVPHSADELAELESAHKALEVYIWLARKLGSGEFVSLREALESAVVTQSLILEGLERLGERELRAGRRARRERQLAAEAAAETEASSRVRRKADARDEAGRWWRGEGRRMGRLRWLLRAPPTRQHQQRQQA